jgi:uncharacterized protein
MRLTVSDIPEDGLQQELELPILLNDSTEHETAQAFITVFRYGKKVLLDGNVRMSVPVNCSRCLKKFSFPVDAAFREEFSPAEEFQEGERELTGKELDLSFYSNDELNMSDVIREQIELSIPMKPLCSADCQGICSKCGKDLNRGSCGCMTAEIDPRLAALEELKKTMEDRQKS